MTDIDYHTSRFTYNPRRKQVWEVLVHKVFQPDIPVDGVVLDLGAGYGEFINAVCARRRIAIDRWEGMTAYLAPGVEACIGSVTELAEIENESIDYAFSSNCFEHLSPDEMSRCLGALSCKLKPGALLDIVQPNFAYCYREYFDDYTHRTIYTDRGLADLLSVSGYQIRRRVPRFLPLTMNSRWPIHPLLVRLYLACPFKPFAKQMWIRAQR